MLENKKLPKDWKLVKIIDVSDINPKLPNRDEIDKEIEVQFLPMKLVEATINKIHLTETKKIIDVMKGSYTPFIDNDIIFAKVTPCMENGKIAVVNNLKNGIGFGSSEFHVLRPKKEVLNKYLFHYIIQDSFRNKAANEMTGAVGLRRVPKKFIEDSLIPIPPIKIQSSIVLKIEELFSELDKGIEDLKTAQQQLKIYRQSVLKWGFEGKLTKEIIKVSIIPFGKIIKVVSGNTPKGLNGIANNGDIQFYKVSDMNLDGNQVEMKISKFNLTAKEIEHLKIKLYPRGTVIFPKRGGAILTNKKRKLSQESSFDLNIMGALPNEKVDSNYLFYWFQKLDLGKICDGSNVPQINNKNIDPLDFQICKIDDQYKIVQEIENRLSVVDKMEESIAQSLKQAEALRQSILKMAFSGELI